MTVSVPAADCEALVPIFAAMSRGTPRSKFRILQVVCPRGHRVVEVFRTADGPYLLAQMSTGWVAAKVPGSRPEPTVVRSGNGWLSFPPTDRQPNPVFEPSCSCAGNPVNNTAPNVTSFDLTDLLAAGRRRVLITDPAIRGAVRGMKRAPRRNAARRAAKSWHLDD